MSKHTPGKWTWSQDYKTSDGRETFTLVGEGGYGILACDGEPNSPQRCNPADAHLIAAAPDLLEAIKEALPFVIVWEGYQSVSVTGNQQSAANARKTYEAIKAVVAKAEGRP